MSPQKKKGTEKFRIHRLGALHPPRLGRRSRPSARFFSAPDTIGHTKTHNFQHGAGGPKLTRSFPEFKAVSFAALNLKVSAVKVSVLTEIPVIPLIE